MPDRPRRVHIDIRCDGPEQTLAEELVRSFEATGLGPAVSLVPVDSEPPTDKPLVVIGPDDDAVMLEAVHDGAMGYVLASAGPRAFEETVLAVARGEAVIPPMMLGTLLRHTVRRQRAIEKSRSRLAVLTDREREVVEHLSRGRQRKEIAADLFISPETVRTHLQRAMAKLGVHSQTELVALFAPLDRGDR